MGIAIKGGFDASGRVLAGGSAAINYSVISTVRYGMYNNKLFYHIGTVAIGIGMCIMGVHMSHSELFHQIGMGMVPTTINYSSWVPFGSVLVCV